MGRDGAKSAAIDKYRWWKLSMKSYFKGVVSESDNILPIDSSLLRGDGVFETILSIDQVAIAWDRHFARLEKAAEKILITTPPKIPSDKSSMNNSMLIITYNEENKDYDFVDCIPILYREFINSHAFIVVGTQESGTKKIKEGLFIRSEATHYPHVLGEYLGMMNYGLALKESAHKLLKIKKNN